MSIITIQVLKNSGVIISGMSNRDVPFSIELAPNKTYTLPNGYTWINGLYKHNQVTRVLTGVHEKAITGHCCLGVFLQDVAKAPIIINPFSAQYRLLEETSAYTYNTHLFPKCPWIVDHGTRIQRYTLTSGVALPSNVLLNLDATIVNNMSFSKLNDNSIPFQAIASIIAYYTMGLHYIINFERFPQWDWCYIDNS